MDTEREHINKKFKSDNTDEQNETVQKEEDEDSEMNLEYEIPEKGFDYPLEQDASDMLDEVDFDNGRIPSVTERYFTRYYQLDVLKPGDDICILIHSNRICMITLAPSHIIFQKNKTIQSCNYKVSDKLDRTKNKVSGKAKHGAQPLQSNSNLCCLTCTDGTNYMIKCCMIGKLVEVNERLIEDPELLKKEPHDGGYIAIALPNLKHLDKMKTTLLTQELYEAALKKRKEKKEQMEQTETKEVEEKIISSIEGNIVKQKNDEHKTNGQNIDKVFLNENIDIQGVEKKENEEWSTIVKEKKGSFKEVTEMEIV